ncbi:MAG: hypothetical protein F4Y45_10730 [Acidobacteria bacterium]|nr:hypothetical protein [Acidobacteriota bacterium]
MASLRGVLFFVSKTMIHDCVPVRVFVVMACLSASVLGLTGCSTEDGRSQENSLVATSLAEAVEGDRFMKHVRAMHKSGDVLYLSGQGYGHILALDDDLGVIRTFGRSGEGPGEFSGAPRNLYAEGNRVFGLQAASNDIHAFSLEGDYLRSFSVDPEAVIWSQGISVNNQGDVYVANSFPVVPYSITKFDSSGTVIKTFGELLTTSYSETFNRRLSGRLITLIINKYLLAVGLSIPVIEKYSLDGELIQSSDLSDTPYFRERLDYAEESYSQAGGGIVSVISYMATLNSRLYLLPIEGYAEVGLRVNRLLEIDVESLNILNAYTLLDHQEEPLRWVEAFEFISEDELLVFHYSDGVFYRYEDIDLIQ